MRKISTHFIGAFCLLICLAVSAIAQEKNVPSNEQNSKSSFSESAIEKIILTQESKKKSKKNKKKTDEETNNEIEKIIAPVIPYSSNGELVKGLKQADFTVFENGVEQEITYFKQSNEAMPIVLMIDISNSAGVKFDLAKDSFINFIDKIRPEDKITVVSYNEKTTLIADVKTEREEIKKKIKKNDATGGTSLYDSIDITLSNFLKDVEGPKAFILLTDGVDTTSEKNSFNEILKKVNDSNAVFSVVYNDTFKDFASGGGLGKRKNGDLNAILAEILKSGVTIGKPGTSGSGITKEEYQIGVSFLNNLVLLSGGNAVKTDSTFEGFKKAFEQIYYQLINQYFVGYKSKNNLTAGQPREIKVRINRPDLFVRTRGLLAFEDK